VQQPNLVRTFKVPALPVIASLGILINIYLMINLSVDAQLLSLSWLVVGFLVYYSYGKRKSKIGQPPAKQPE
jgi:APA family basic amino acid/polyamine antiporter